MFKKVSGSTLGLFRILLGVLLLDNVYYLQAYITQYLMHSKFFFKYDGFEWVQIMEPFWLQLFFCVLYLCIVIFILGVYYRFFSVLVFLGYTYLFLLDKGHYNNHYYFYSLVLFLFMFLKADAWGALGKRKQQEIPYWNVFVLKAQIFIVYFYGAIAKLQGDWLNGFPTKFWMYDIGANHEEGSFLRELYQSEWFPYVISYGGLAFDGLIGFMLFSKRWRRLAVPIVFAFHFNNANTFNIGTFPYSMMAATLLFASPDFIERKWNYFNENGVAGVFRSIRNPLRKLWNWVWPRKLTSTKSNFQNQQAQPMILGFIVVWFSIQCLVPFRHLLYKGNPSWTGEGHLFAWRMMLVDTVEGVQIKVRGDKNEPWVVVDIPQYMYVRQFRKSIRTPRSMLQFTSYLKDDMIAAGVESPQIHMTIYKSINERPPLLLNDTTLNYALVENTPFSSCSWINPWSESDLPAEFSLDKFKHWKKKIEEDAFKGNPETDYQESF